MGVWGIGRGRFVGVNKGGVDCVYIVCGVGG